MITQAAVLYGMNEQLVIDELELPILKEGQVLVKILYAGVCHSQLNEIKGLKGEDRFLPHLLGHEGSGIIEEIGPEVTKVKKGDYVVLSWIKGEGKDIPSSQYSLNEKKINSGAIATFNQYSVISENRVCKITTEVPPDVAALLGCAIPTGAGIIKNEIGLKKQDSIVIFGIGGIGSGALIYASSLGCTNVIAVDINNEKLNFAKEIGATHTINSTTENPITKIREITDGKGVDYAVECSGNRQAMELAYQSIKDSGTAVIAGNLKKEERISIDPFDLIKGKKIIGTWGGKTNPDEDTPYYAQKYLNEGIRFNKLITKIYPLKSINQAIKDLEEGKVIRAMINCQL